MSKGSGMGRKRSGAHPEKGIGRCDTSSHSKQCGNGKYVSKGNKQQDLQFSQEFLHKKTSQRGSGGLEFDEEEKYLFISNINIFAYQFFPFGSENNKILLWNIN